MDHASIIFRAPVLSTLGAWLVHGLITFMLAMLVFMSLALGIGHSIWLMHVPLWWMLVSAIGACVVAWPIWRVLVLWCPTRLELRADALVIGSFVHRKRIAYEDIRLVEVIRQGVPATDGPAPGGLAIQFRTVRNRRFSISLSERDAATCFEFLRELHPDVAGIGPDDGVYLGASSSSAQRQLVAEVFRRRAARLRIASTLLTVWACSAAIGLAVGLLRAHPQAWAVAIVAPILAAGAWTAAIAAKARASDVESEGEAPEKSENEPSHW